MTNTKLEIIGPYTPEHPGPFCTRDGKPVRILCNDRSGMPPILALAQDGSIELIISARPDGVAVCASKHYDLMNAREVPVAREFWLADNKVFATKEKADFYAHWMHKVIHVREVLPGDEA